MKKSLFLAIVALVFVSGAAFAEGKTSTKKSTMFDGSTNIQLFYDLGIDRNLVTTTIEGFYNDPWGNTYFFVDHDFPVQGDASLSINGTYWEIARCLNFWKDSKVAPLSIQVEYNGGVYRGFGINHAFLVGADWFLHSKDFRNTFNFKLLYKHIFYNEGFYGKYREPNALEALLGIDKVEVIEKNHQSLVPLQFTFVWGMKDLFNVKGLTFNGFVDFWGEDHWVTPMKTVRDDDGQLQFVRDGEDVLSHFVLISEPQLWYSVGQHFGCPNLNVGGELELSWGFGTVKNFMARPCLGVKWVF